MISADDFLIPASDSGLDFFTGVPCSFLTPVINRVIGASQLDYVGAASEGEAIAIAAGAWLAGHQTTVMFQNSGLGNAVNPLTSLNYPFRIPTLLIVTWRGGPGVKDEPQHILMGQITPGILDQMKIPHRPFPKSPDAAAAAITEALQAMNETGLPFAFIMETGDVAEEPLDAKAPTPRPSGVRVDHRNGTSPPSRYKVLEQMLATAPETAAIIATTGKCGRELFTIADRPQHLYQVGSMGCAGPMGLGVALNVKRPVIVVDGDGAALMKMGSLGTVGAYGTDNLIHLVLDNGTYDSTGGQPTVSGSVDFAAAAIACGYAGAASADDLDGFDAALKSALDHGGPYLVHMKIAPGSLSNLGRPSVTPDAVARRFRDFLTG